MSGFSETAPIVARFRWHPREAYRALAQIARRGLPMWPLYISFLVLAALNGGPEFVRQWERGGWAAVDFVFLAWTFAPVILVAMLVPVSALWVAHRAVPAGAETSVEQIVSIGDGGVRANTPLVAGDLRWASLTRAVETGEFFLLFVSRMQALYVPKRSLGGAMQVEAVRSMLRSHMGARAELRRG